MRRTLILLAILGLFLVAVPQSALAEKPAWSYVEAGYNDVSVDNPSLDDDGDGGFAGLSVGFFKNFHAFGRYITNGTDDADIDINTLMLGGGWHGLLGEKADLVGEVAWIDQEFDGSSFNADDNGYFARVGVRWRPVKLFEIGGSVRHQDVGDLEDDQVYELNAMVHLWRLSFGVAAEQQDDAEIETFTAFARFNFGG